MTLMERFMKKLKISADEEYSSTDQSESISEPVNVKKELGDYSNAQIPTAIYNNWKIVQELLTVIDSTTDNETFFLSLTKAKEILKDLIQYEQLYDFAVMPSENLKSIETSESKITERFKNRCDINKSKSCLSTKVNDEKTPISKTTKKEIDSTEKEITKCNSIKGDYLVNGNDSNQIKAEAVIEKSTNTNDISHSIQVDSETEKQSTSSTKSNVDEDNAIIEKDNSPYKSNRIMIAGLDLHFIDIAREVFLKKCINKIPLMREYHLSEERLNQIIRELQDARILDSDNNILMGSEELEKFIDIYEPNIFKCEHSVFDKEIFMCIGEIIFDKGVEDTYNSLSADEVIDYLNIMEKLKVISYDSTKNEYDILMSKENFDKICSCIPDSFANTVYTYSGNNYTDVNFDTMSGIEFEKYCAYILSQNGFDEIKITPPSGDHGIDILAEKDGVTYAIQCKCYSSNIGNAAIQQAHTGKSLYHKDIAVVMTNQYFTQQAIEESKSLSVKLWDRNKLYQMINDHKEAL